MDGRGRELERMIDYESDGRLGTEVWEPLAFWMNEMHSRAIEPF